MPEDNRKVLETNFGIGRFSRNLSDYYNDIICDLQTVRRRSCNTQRHFYLPYMFRIKRGE